MGSDAGPRLFRRMEWPALLKEFYLKLDLPGHRRIHPGHLQNALRRFQGLGKLPSLGKGDGENVKQVRIFPTRQRIGVPLCAGAGVLRW